MVLLAPALAGLFVGEYSPASVKQAVVGSGRAQKDQVGMMVRTLLPGCRVESGAFACLRPEAGEVFLVGTFNRWDPRATPMEMNDNGDWSAVLLLPEGEHRYRLMIDGGWHDDPSAQVKTSNPFGGFDCVVVV